MPRLIGKVTGKFVTPADVVTRTVKDSVCADAGRGSPNWTFETLTHRLFVQSCHDASVAGNGRSTTSIVEIDALGMLDGMSSR